MLGSKNFIIEELQEESKYWRERCERFTSVIHLFGLDEETLDQLVSDCKLTPNDVRYLKGMKELSDYEGCVTKTIDIPKPAESKRLWIWKRICEFNDYFDACMEANVTPDKTALPEYCELVDMWCKEDKKK